jgi:hypothetical protein
MSFFPNDLEQYIKIPVATGETVTANKFVEMINSGVKNVVGTIEDSLSATVSDTISTNSVQTTFMKASKISENKILILMRYSTGTCYGIIASIVGSKGNVKVGTLAVIENVNTTQFCKIHMVNENTAVVLTGTGTVTSNLVARQLHMADLSITPGVKTKLPAPTIMTSHPDMVALNNGSYYLFVSSDQYRLTGGFFTTTGLSAPISVSGTLGGFYMYQDGAKSYPFVNKINENMVIMTFRETSTSLIGFSTVSFDFELNQFTLGTKVVTDIDCFSIGAVLQTISDKKYVIFYNDGSQDKISTISLNESYEFLSVDDTIIVNDSDTAHTQSLSLTRITDDVYIASGNQRVSGNDVYQYIYINSDNTITAGIQKIFSLDTEKLGLCQQSVFVNNCIITAGKRVSDGHLWTVGRQISIDESKNVIGIAKEDGVEGDDVSISIGTLVSGFSNLTPGKEYYATKDGEVREYHGTIDTPLGLAVSEDTIKLYKKA